MNKIFDQLDIILSSTIDERPTIHDVINSYRHGDLDFAIKTLIGLKGELRLFAPYEGKDIIEIPEDFKNAAKMALLFLSDNENMINFKKGFDLMISRWFVGIRFSLFLKKNHKIEINFSDKIIFFKVIKPTPFRIHSYDRGAYIIVYFNNFNDLHKAIKIGENIINSCTLEDYKNNILRLLSIDQSANSPNVITDIKNTFLIYEKMKPFLSKRILPVIVIEYDIVLLLTLRNNFGLKLTIKKDSDGDSIKEAIIFVQGNFSTNYNQTTINASTIDQLLSELELLFKRRSPQKL